MLRTDAHVLSMQRMLQKTFELRAGINAAVGAEPLDSPDIHRLAAESHGSKPLDSKANQLQTLADLSLNEAVVEG
jgi:hypothetical protein